MLRHCMLVRGRETAVRSGLAIDTSKRPAIRKPLHDAVPFYMVRNIRDHRRVLNRGNSHSSVVNKSLEETRWMNYAHSMLLIFGHDEVA
jgi:hypothetical protein